MLLSFDSPLKQIKANLKIENVWKNIFDQNPFSKYSTSIGIAPESPYNGLNFRHLSSLKSIGSLADNWDNDGAKAPVQSVMQLVKAFVSMMDRIGQEVYNVAPGPYGEVMIDLRNDDKSVEILFYPDKTKFVKFSPSEEPSQGIYIPEQLDGLLSWLNSESLEHAD